MKRSAITPMPQFFDRYINQVEDIDINEALEKYNSMETVLDMSKLEKLGDKIYAPGKWTVKEVIQHITDNERVQAYRALRISRNDQTPLPGYDEGLFAANVDPSGRSLNDLLEEFAIVRKANIILFRNINEEQQKRTGLCNNVTIPVLALGFVLVGHQLHHAKIITEKYFPLLEK
jgi:enhancing lycopene biosynthesis protein 2